MSVRREPCADCEGTGWEERVGGEIPCRACEGLGVCPTCEGLLIVCDTTGWYGDPETEPESFDCPCQVVA